MSLPDEQEDPHCSHCRKLLSRLARVCPRCAHRVTSRPAVTTAEAIGWYKMPTPLPPRWP